MTFINKIVLSPVSTSFKNKDEKLIINFAWPYCHACTTKVLIK